MKFFNTCEQTSFGRQQSGRRCFVKKLAAGFAATVLLASSSVVFAETEGLEKEDLKLGFIKLTDMVPLAIAYEKGYFEDEGLYVTLEAQANWRQA